MLFPILTLLLAPGTPAGPAPPAGAPVVVPFEEFDQLEKDFKRAALEWRRAQRVARRAGQPFDEPHPIHDWFGRFEALAEAGDGQALLWVGLNVQDTSRAAEEVARTKRTTLARVAREFATEPFVDELVQAVSKQAPWLDVDERVALLEPILSRNESRKVAAHAGFELAELLAAREDDASKARAEELYRLLVTEYEETRHAEKAQARLDAKQLQIGKVAPDFDAVDVDGNAFKLSDYRGKVTVIDFWGFW